MMDVNLFTEPKPSGMPVLPVASADMDAWESGDEQGQFMYGELEKEALKNMAGTGYLGIQDTPSYTGSIEAEPSIWDRTMAIIAGVAGNNYTGDVGFPGGHANVIENSAQVPAYSSGMTIPPSLQEGGDEQGKIFYDALQDEARKAVITNPDITADTSNSLVNSMIAKELEKKHKKEVAQQVSQNLSNIFIPEPPTFVNYGPPNMQFLGRRYGL